MTTDVNLLIRGQSNALLFVADGGAASLEKQIEARLPGVDIHILASYGQSDSTIHAGTAFLDWDTDGEQQSLLNVLKAEPADIRDNPTVTLWMHNEYDGNTPGVTTAQWVSEVTADAALVRSALGQGSATTPYVFTYVPYNYVKGDSWQQIQTGMNQLSADAGFNATFDSAAMDGLAMDGDGYANSSHMGVADAYKVADQLAATMAETVGGLTAGRPVVTPPVVTPPVAPTVDTTPVVKTIGSGSDALVLKISQDVYLAGAQYTVSVDGKQIGGTLTAGASACRRPGRHHHRQGRLGRRRTTTSPSTSSTTPGAAPAAPTATSCRRHHLQRRRRLRRHRPPLFSAGPLDFAFTEAAAPVVTPPIVRPRRPSLPRRPARHRPHPRPVRRRRRLGPGQPGLDRPPRLRRHQLRDLRRQAGLGRPRHRPGRAQDLGRRLGYPHRRRQFRHREAQPRGRRPPGAGCDDRQRPERRRHPGQRPRHRHLGRPQQPCQAPATPSASRPAAATTPSTSPPPASPRWPTTTRPATAASTTPATTAPAPPPTSPSAPATTPSPSKAGSGWC